MPKSKFLFSKQLGEETIIVEGVFDVMNMWENGFKNCAAVLGADLSDHQITTLLENGVKRLIIYADGDQGGVSFIEKAITHNKFFDIDIMACKWGKDPSDMSIKESQLAYENKVNYKGLIKEKDSDNLDFLSGELDKMDRKGRKNKSYFY